MKEPDTHLVVSAAPTPPSVVLPSVDTPALVTDAEANAAAKSLGMKFFRAEKTYQLKRIGMFRAQQGVVHLGVGRIAACEEALQKMIDTAVDISSDKTEDTERRVGALIAGKGLVEVMQKGIQIEVEFQTDKLIGGPEKVQKKRSFETDQPIIPIQAQSGSTVNIGVDAAALVKQS